MRVTLYDNNAEPIEGFVNLALPQAAVNNFIHSIFTKDVIPAIHRETQKLIASAEGFQEGGEVTKAVSAVFLQEKMEFIQYAEWRRSLGENPSTEWISVMRKKRLQEFPFQRFEWGMIDPDIPSYGLRTLFTYRFHDAPPPPPLRSERLVLERHITTWMMDTLISKGNNDGFLVKVRMDDPWLRARIRESIEMFNGSYAPTFQIKPKMVQFKLNRQDPLYLHIYTNHTSPSSWPNEHDSPKDPAHQTGPRGPDQPD